MSLVLAPSPSAPPVVAHWGAALGPLAPTDLAGLVALQQPALLHSSHDVPRRRGLLSENVSGFSGLPGLEGFRPRRSGHPWAPRLRSWSWQVDDTGDDALVHLTGDDPEAGWRVDLDLELTVEGLLRLRPRVTNTGDDPLELAAVRSALPVGPHATELLDLAGHWSRERLPQRGPWRIGTHLRESRHGRPGHDAPFLLAAGVPGFTHRTGEVWAVHVAHSGDSALHGERTADGDCLLGGGVLLGPGEITLGPGEQFTAPWLVGTWSAAGLDDASYRVHRWLRRRHAPARSRRPVVVNTWEASYFDHDLARLTTLADLAAGVGAERFVLDDGWFRGRRDDRRGLGDWTVDPDVWPDGLRPLFDHVRALGMDVGLWVEPEMVNADSALARTHPDWLLRGRADLPDEWRHQQVLDLQVEAAWTHVLEAVSALVTEHDLAFLKWDHNRDLVDVAHGGRPAVHGQTAAALALLDELRRRHPALEVETCASGGGRIDLDILTRTDRVWPSDTIDALERQRIQRWTGLLVPPEMTGTHVGAGVAHTTGRSHTLGFRAATALLGHFGIEWDLARATPAELDELAWWVSLHRSARPTIGTGVLVHGDHPDPAVLVTGVVSPGADEAWFVVATIDSTGTRSPTPVRLPGLDPTRSYRVHRMTSPRGGEAPDDPHRANGLDHRPTTSGAALGGVGVQLHAMAPETAEVLHLTGVHD